MQLSEIYIDGERLEVYKNGIFNTCGFLHQQKKNILSFISSKKYLHELRNDKILSIICPKTMVNDVVNLRKDIGIIVYENPRELIFKISNKIKSKNFKSIISNSAKISDKAIISESNVYIGKDCIIEDNVIIKENVIIKDNVRIGTGTILGTEGLMVYDSGVNKKIAVHNGYLYIDSNSIMLNNIIVERAVFHGDVTYIGKNVILDSGVSISHGCKINSSTTLAACAKICGYTEIGKESYIGPGAVISNNIKLGDRCNIRIGSVVVDNLKKNSDVSSTFAIDHQMNLINRFNTLKNYKKIRGANNYE